jgi:hypothetical protein
MKKISFVFYLVLIMLMLPVAVSAYGNISVSSTPTGATILLNGSSTGATTSATFENVAAGSHTVLLQLTGYVSNTTTIPVVDGITTALSVTLVANAPTITSIIPSNGFNNSAVSITNLAGTGFTGTPTVVLMKSNQTNITATGVSVVSATQITCSFNIIGKTAGLWDVVVTNPDGQAATLANGFEIKNPATAVTLSSITPDNAVANSTATISDLSGTAFATGATIYLKRASYNNIPGTVSSLTATTIQGTFNLTGWPTGAYQVCVANTGADAVCGLTFTITPMTVIATANGSVLFESSPSGAKAFISSTYKGTTPVTVYNVTPGTYSVLVQKAGYQDYSKSITVTAGNRTDVFARLDAEVVTTTAITTAPTTAATVATTTKKSTLKTPTPWPTDTPTPASASGTLVVIGAAGLGIIALRKR